MYTGCVSALNLRGVVDNVNFCDNVNVDDSCENQQNTALIRLYHIKDLLFMVN